MRESDRPALPFVCVKALCDVAIGVRDTCEGDYTMSRQEVFIEHQWAVHYDVTTLLARTLRVYEAC